MTVKHTLARFDAMDRAYSAFLEALDAREAGDPATEQQAACRMESALREYEEASCAEVMES